jgi:DNA-damage-inducible protein J
MSTKTVSIRMDKDLYRDFSQFCEEVYLSPSALFSSFAARTVREQRIPFDIAVDPFYSATNQARIKASIDQLERGEGTVHELIEN